MIMKLIHNSSIQKFLPMFLIGFVVFAQPEVQPQVIVYVRATPFYSPTRPKKEPAEKDGLPTRQVIEYVGLGGAIGKDHRSPWLLPLPGPDQSRHVVLKQERVAYRQPQQAEHYPPAVISQGDR